MTEEVDTMGATDDVRQLATPIVTLAGLELWDVEVGGGVVRVLVDRPDGVDLDALSEVSRALSTALDGRDELVAPGRYQLEVSSPGVERNLRTPAQYRRYVGSEVSVKLGAPLEGARRLRGVLVEADDQGVRLRAGAVTHDLAYSQIERARTVLVWGGGSSTRSMSAAPSAAAPKPKDTT